MDAVVVSHNSAADLGPLLSRELFSEFDRVIVVDNDSRDGSQALAVAGGAELIPLSANVGYAAAANRGARLVTGDAFAIVNPDIRFIELDTVERLTRHLEDESVAMVVPALVLPDGRIQDSVRRVPTPLDLVARRLLGSPRGAIRLDEPGDAPWAVGAFMLVRRAAFEALCGFDERYWLYFEDVDLCVRLREVGWRIVHDPTVRVLHHHRAASRKTLLGAAARAHLRSAWRFYRRHSRYVLGGA